MGQLLPVLPVLGFTLAWLMPLHLLPWVAWHSEVPVFAGVLLAATWTVVRLLRRRAVAVPAPTLAAAMVGLGLLALLQAAFGVVRFAGDAWTVMLYALLCAAAFALGHWQAQDDPQGRAASDAMAWTLLAAGLGCTAIALVQALDVWTDAEWIARAQTLRRAGSNLAQPNQMATLVLMASASLLYLAERGRIGRGTAAQAWTFLAAGLATTESRTGLVASAALVAWWFCKDYRGPIRTRDVGFAVAVLAAFYVAWPPLVEAYHGQGGPELARVSTKVGLRAIVWPQLMQAAAERPWVGWGARQTSVALTQVAHAYPVSEPYTYAHNIVLELVLAFGIPAGILVVAAAVFWVCRRWHRRADLGGWYCMAVCVPVVIHALLEFPYSYAYVLAPAMFAAGLLDGRSGVVPRRSLPAVALLGMLACTWVIAAWSVIEYVQVEEDFRVARFEAGRIGATPADYERPRIRLLTQLGAMLEAARIVPQPGMPAQQVAFAGDVAARFPWPALQNRYALALALNGEPAGAERELRVILAMHGEGILAELQLNWETLREDRFPQLGTVHFPQVPAPVTSAR